MYHIKHYIPVILFLIFSLVAQDVFACEMCTIPRLGRQEQLRETEGLDNKWFVEFLFEEQNWDARPAQEAHELHEDGHHIHNKTSEYFYHLTLGGKISDEFSIIANLPYVMRNSLGVEDGKVGHKDRSEGFGDLNLISQYRIFHTEASAVNVVGGFKFPTGDTDEKDFTGETYEPELQPGSGSLDYLLGGVFEHQIDRFIFKGNATYNFKNEGAQDFEFGNLFSTSLFADYVLNPDADNWQTKLGMDLNYQFAQKDKDNGVKESDSGGHTVLFGPTMTVYAKKDISFFGNFLYPVYQHLNGVHQEMDFVWTAGGKIVF